MFIWWLLNFFGVFFCWKLTKPCRQARTFHLMSQQSLASINNKNSNILTKRPPVAITVTSDTHRHHWELVFSGIPSDLRSMPDQSHHLRGALLRRWLQAVYRVSNGCPNLQLRRNGAYIHYLWLNSENTIKKLCYLTKANIHQKWKWWIYNIFAFLCILMAS